MVPRRAATPTPTATWTFSSSSGTTPPTKRELRGIGYDLAATSHAVPSILAYSLKEWQERSARGYPFQRAVERDGVSVL